MRQLRVDIAHIVACDLSVIIISYVFYKFHDLKIVAVALHPQFEATVLSFDSADGVQKHVFDFVLNIQKLGGVQIRIVEYD
jgi:hypothetical protein